MLSFWRFKPGTSSAGITNYCENGAINNSSQRTEDYYTEKGQAGGYLLGSGWAGAGLGRNDYAAQHIQRAFEGRDVKTGEVLVSGMKNKLGESTRVPGWDMTFSADKSVSVLWARAAAAGDEKMKQLIIDSQEFAVARTVKYIEDHVLTVNVGKAAKERDRSELFASAHNHATSRPTRNLNGTIRPGDPDIHTHLLLANYTRRSDGKIMSLNSTDIFKRKKELGCIYRAAQAEFIKREAGLHIEKHGEDNSLIRIDGSPKDVERAMSKRRQEIESYETEIKSAMDKFHKTKGAATDFITKQKRNSKSGGGELDLTTAELEKHWGDELDGYGYTKDVYDDLIASSRNEKREYKLDNDEIFKLATQYNSVFTEWNLRETIVFAGAGILSVDEIEDRFAELMASDEIKQLTKRTADRQIKDKKTGEWRIKEGSSVIVYSTREMIALERDMLVQAKSLRESDTHAIDAKIVLEKQLEFENKTGFKLSDDQVQALTAATTGGDLVVIQGYAGSGKTAGICVAKSALESCGYSVRGCAPSGKAAAGLAAAGIEAETIAKVVMEHNGWTDKEGKFHEPKNKLTKNDVLVIDEVGMVGSRDFHALTLAANSVGAKLVVMGDDVQLQAVAAGGPLSAVGKEIGGVDAVLTKVHRQKEGTDIAKVVEHSRFGEIHKSFDILDRLGNLALVENQEDARVAVIDAWKKHYAHNSPRAEETSIMLANRNVDVDDLNKMARTWLKETGAIDTTKSVKLDVTDKWGSYSGQREFCENERIVFLANAKIGEPKQAVKNGQTGRLLAIKGTMLTVKMDGSDKVVSFSTEKYSRVGYAYSLTTHKSQGISVGHASILAGGGMQTLNQTYVQLSRVKDGVDFVVPKASVEMQMASSPASEKMMNLALKTAKNLGHDEGLVSEMSFLDCRNYLNDNVDWKINGEPESSRDRWRREIGSLMETMSTLQIKETTLDYEVSETKTSVVNVFTHGEISTTAKPEPMLYQGEPRVLDTEFKKQGNEYVWADSGRVALIDAEDKIKVKSKHNDAIQASLELARQNFGEENSIKATGSESFRQQVWLIGNSLGLEIKGYTPTQDDLDRLDRIIDEIEIERAKEVREDEQEIVNNRAAEEEIYRNEISM